MSKVILTLLTKLNFPLSYRSGSESMFIPQGGGKGRRLATLWLLAWSSLHPSERPAHLMVLQIFTQCWQLLLNNPSEPQTDSTIQSIHVRLVLSWQAKLINWRLHKRYRRKQLKLFSLSGHYTLILSQKTTIITIYDLSSLGKQPVRLVP